MGTQTIAQERIALVIGNSAYDVQHLANPANDATDVAAALRHLGFDVDLQLDADLKKTKEAIKRFGTRLSGETVGLFYYSGHAMQYEGTNYLIPTDAMSRVTEADDLRWETMDIDYVLRKMNARENALNIVILDACRVNPFRSFSRGFNMGLTKTQNVEGTLIAYATAAGRVAVDGSNQRNSPYTEHLLKHIKEPNLKIEDF